MTITSIEDAAEMTDHFDYGLDSRQASL